MSTDGLLARAGQALFRGWRFRRPPHAFVLTEDRLVHVSLARDGRAAKGTPLAVASRPLPAGTFATGAAGAPVAGPGLAREIGELLSRAGRVPAASLAVPDGFVRVAPVDVEPGGGKSPRDLAEVLRWKVSRLYGEPAPALRISWCAAGEAPGGGERLLVLASPEETIASLESAFASHGVRIGALEPASLALSTIAGGAISGSGIVVFTDGPNVSTVFLEGGAVRFLRTREAAADPDQALQEIRLAASFVGGSPVDGPGLDLTADAVVVPESSPVSLRFREFRSENGAKEPCSILPTLLTMGLPARTDDTAPLVGLGLLKAAD